MAVIVCLTVFYVFYIAEKYIVLYLQKYTMNFVNEFMPLWYTLSCDNESAGDALQMANEFYESGLFEFAEPDLSR